MPPFIIGALTPKTGRPSRGKFAISVQEGFGSPFILEKTMIDLLIYIVAIALGMVVDALLGIIEAEHYGDFSKDVLIKSLKKYGALLLATFGLMGIGMLLPNFTFDFGGTEVTIEVAMKIVANALLLVYVSKDIKNLVDVLGLEEIKEDDKG